MKGNLETILLAVIDGKGRVYGQEIVREVQTRSGGALLLGPGSLYPPLRRLEQRGWIHGERQFSPTGNGEVTYYTLTESGRAGLTKQRELTRAFIRDLEKLTRL